MEISSAQFLWDYDLSPDEIQIILKGPESQEKDWLITRILEHATWETIWRYLNLKTIQEHLDHLPLKPSLKSLWQYALKRWA